MSITYITGHRNPDMDSICAAYAYAELKNIQSHDEEYKPVRCGDAKAPAKALFKELKVPLPELMKDIYPRVSDVIRRDITTLDGSAPILEAIRELDSKNLSIIPVFNEDEEFTGVLSHHEISKFLISENIGKRPLYHFRTSNFKKVVPGYFYQRGKDVSIKAPLMTGAMPFETSLHRLAELKEDKPVLVIGLRNDLLAFAVKSQLPAIIITGLEKDQSLEVDFSEFEGTVYVSHTDTAETIRLLRLSAPVEQIMEKNPLKVDASCDFDSAKRLLLDSPFRGLPVMSKSGFSGIVTRRCFIEKPRKNLILVDHNEIDQSIPGAEQARITEILDHHRIDTTKTRDPIYIYARPLGSTCTIILLHFQISGIEPSPETSALLLGGLVSDTLNLRSPTTTREDIAAAEALEAISPLSREDIAALIFSHSSSLKNGAPREILLMDFKTYKERGYSVGIGQVEVTTLAEVDAVKEEYVKVLNKIRIEKQLDWTMLLVTDVIKQDSVLFTSGFEEGEKRFIYNYRGEGVFDLPGVLSRKKQLFPEVYRILEEVERKA
ncbi:MAG: putative manganese-dependent inorganic diphosphatase [Spirochaetales bacterium]|nr:putative manganese-dependent inorganic diphosphatase [Spirochaetales bacterium]